MTTTTKALNAQFRYREIPLELINAPELPERETMEEVPLADLALNIAEVGLIKPLVVIENGERFDVVAGHRRFIACSLAKYTPVPCRIMVKAQVDPLAVMVAENAHTEAVNPVEEARFYARLLEERCNNDVDQVCAMVRRRREHVEGRLLLLLGSPRVADALQEKKISLAVAKELNKIQDPNRLLILLDVAIAQGATAAQVIRWRQETDQMQAIDTSGGQTEVSDAVPPINPQPFQMECLFCEDSEHPHMMELVYIHKPCKSLLLRMLQRAQGVTPQ